MTGDRIDEIIQEPAKAGNDAGTQRVLDAWKAILMTRNGRLVARDLLQICHYGLSPWEGDKDQCVFIAGKQKVGEEVMNMINLAAPDSYTQMMKEAKEDEAYDRQQHNDASSDTSSDTSSSDTRNTSSESGTFG